MWNVVSGRYAGLDKGQRCVIFNGKDVRRYWDRNSREVILQLWGELR